MLENEALKKIITNLHGQPHPSPQGWDELAKLLSGYPEPDNEVMYGMVVACLGSKQLADDFYKYYKAHR